MLRAFHQLVDAIAKVVQAFVNKETFLVELLFKADMCEALGASKVDEGQLADCDKLLCLLMGLLNADGEEQVRPARSLVDICRPHDTIIDSRVEDLYQLFDPVFILQVGGRDDSSTIDVDQVMLILLD